MIWFIPMDKDFVHNVHISLYPSSCAPQGDWLDPMNRDFVHLVHISPYSQNFAPESRWGKIHTHHYRRVGQVAHPVPMPFSP